MAVTIARQWFQLVMAPVASGVPSTPVKMLPVFMKARLVGGAGRPGLHLSVTERETSWYWPSGMVPPEAVILPLQTPFTTMAVSGSPLLHVVPPPSPAARASTEESEPASPAAPAPPWLPPPA